MSYYGTPVPDHDVPCPLHCAAVSACRLCPTCVRHISRPESFRISLRLGSNLPLLGLLLLSRVGPVPGLDAYAQPAQIRMATDKTWICVAWTRPRGDATWSS